jgi:hypothetical protein
MQQWKQTKSERQQKEFLSMERMEFCISKYGADE